MNIQRPAGQFEYWYDIWASGNPVEIDGKKWKVATVDCADICNINLVEITLALVSHLRRE